MHTTSYSSIYCCTLVSILYAYSRVLVCILARVRRNPLASVCILLASSHYLVLHVLLVAAGYYERCHDIFVTNDDPTDSLAASCSRATLMLAAWVSMNGTEQLLIICVPTKRPQT